MRYQTQDLRHLTAKFLMLLCGEMLLVLAALVAVASADR
jgi:hypothetical protein